MEFKDVFLGLGVVLVAVIALFSFSDGLNNQYGSNIGDSLQANNTRAEVNELLRNNLLNDSFAYATSTQPTAGAESQQGEDNLVTRALSTIGLLDELIGLVPALIKEGAIALGIPEIYWQIASALFYIVFAIVLAYLLLLGARSIFG